MNNYKKHAIPKILKSLTIGFSLFLGGNLIYAQDVSPSDTQETIKVTKHVVTLNNGAEHIGQILEDDGHNLLMQTETLGKFFIPKYEVKSIVELEDEKYLVNNEYQPEGPFTTRYTFTTNALPIRKGENYGMLNLYGPEAHIAVTDQLNVGVMSTWIASPLVLAVKYSFNSEDADVNFSFGSLLGSSGYINNFRGYGGLHWLNMTIGDRRNNITFSGGYAYLQTGGSRDLPEEGHYHSEQAYYDAYNYSYENNDFIKKDMLHGPIFSIAGIAKIGAKASFVFDSMLGYISYTNTETVENYSYDNTNNAFSAIVTDTKTHATVLFIMPGVRFQNSDRKAFQISLAGVSFRGEQSGSFPLPMCTWFYRF